VRHPSPQTLYEYAAGRLPPAHATLVETHLAICQTCAASIQAAEQAIGERLALLPPAEVDLDMAFARFEERVRAETPPPSSPPPARWTGAPYRCAGWGPACLRPRCSRTPMEAGSTSCGPSPAP
jgi:anti-sigma factor RsiW